MKKRILIAGLNEELIDGLFSNLYRKYDLMTTSLRDEDLKCHLSIFNPDAFVYCVSYESSREADRIGDALSIVKETTIPFIAIGNDSVFNAFSKKGETSVDLFLDLSTPIDEIADTIDMNVERFSVLRAKENERNSVSLAQEVSEPAEKQKGHITVIDDDPKMIKIIKEYLKDDFEVAAAVNGRVALRFLETKDTDLILLDYMMPEMDGPEVFEKIRMLSKHKNTPIVFLTGMSERDKIAKAIGLKPQGYLLKPVERERVVNTVKDILNSRK